METGLLMVLTTTFIHLSSCTLYTQRSDQRLIFSPMATVTFNKHRDHVFGQCIMKCKMTSGCVSVNVRRDSVTSALTCELLSVYLHEVPRSLTSAPGWSFIQEDSPWALAFRVTNGIGTRFWNILIDDGHYGDTDEMRSCIIPSSALPCQGHFRSYIIDRWTNIDQVRVRLYTDGSVANELIFDGRNSTRLSWFTRTRLLASPWTDLSKATIFSATGGSSGYRRFYVALNKSCSLDTGWMLVMDYANIDVICDWAQLPPFKPPLIVYSNTSTFCNWRQGRVADFMMIHVTFTT
ncbi:uncharacterized protein LOC143286624 [Babylonia areolata]|uniref:uncharacterized protein LOC143286624 n=1 Tax=Babylonia areolata TaxID=304850 RepID=UPI003FD5BFC6